MKFLHIARNLMAGIPAEFVKMERAEGHDSHLVYYENPGPTEGFPVIPQFYGNNAIFSLYRKLRYKSRYQDAASRVTQSVAASQFNHEPLWQPNSNIVERVWRRAKDWRVKKKIPGIIKDFNLKGYDVIFFHGARDLTWGGHLARALKNDGAKIISVFHGTELRVEGVNRAMHALTDLNITMEQDHLALHPDIYFIFMPFDVARFKVETDWTSRIKIMHAPSNRYNKGTDIILPVMDTLKQKYDFDFILLEGVSQEEVRRQKARCHLCIDHVGNRGGTGYGVSSLESFAMGVPCVADFTEEMRKFLPEHPFFLADKDNVSQVLEAILQKPEVLAQRGATCRQWVEDTHGFESVYNRLRELCHNAGIHIT